MPGRPGLPPPTAPPKPTPPAANNDAEPKLSDLDEGGLGHSPADEIILEESERIVTDYVAALAAKR